MTKQQNQEINSCSVSTVAGIKISTNLALGEHGGVTVHASEGPHVRSHGRRVVARAAPDVQHSLLVERESWE